jgi:hypothetical protein
MREYKYQNVVRNLNDAAAFESCDVDSFNFNLLYLQGSTTEKDTSLSIRSALAYIQFDTK